MSQVSGMSGFKISGTSGFDMDYASHIRAAGREQVDLMIQSSWTWGAFGARHAAGDAMRAVENGFTLLRCSSDGVTAVYSPQGETIATHTHTQARGRSLWCGMTFKFPAAPSLFIPS